MKKSLVLSLLVLATPLLAKNPVVPAGYDTWQTLGGGATFISFADEPVPADFFCDGSSPFFGKINFEGAPLATDPPGMFAITDTVVERLDDVVFKNGEGFSRLRGLALHLVSREPVETPCGSWHVRVGLTDKQPVTTIGFTQNDRFSGTFSAELVLTVRLTFTNTEDESDTRAIERTVHFTEWNDAGYNLPLAPERVTKRGPAANRADVLDSLLVDSDADGLPDKVMRQVANQNFVQINDELWHIVQPHAHSVRATILGGNKNRTACGSPALDGCTTYDIDKLRATLVILDDKGLLDIPVEQLLDETINH